MNKLQQARRKKLLQQEMTADETSIIRQQLKDGITLENWNDGFFPPIDESLPDVFFFQQTPEGLRPTIWYDYEWIDKKHIDFNYRRLDVPSEQQCKEDAERITP